MPVEVRVATSAELADAVMKFKGGGDSGAFAAAAGSWALVAKDDERLIGWCWGVDAKRPDGRSMFYLHEIDVEADRRRLGIGRALIQAALDLAGSRGAFRLFLITDGSDHAATAFYTAVGGREVTSQESILFTFDLSAVE